MPRYFLLAIVALALLGGGAAIAATAGGGPDKTAVDATGRQNDATSLLLPAEWEKSGMPEERYSAVLSHIEQVKLTQKTVEDVLAETEKIKEVVRSNVNASSEELAKSMTEHFDQLMARIEALDMPEDSKQRVLANLQAVKTGLNDTLSNLPAGTAKSARAQSGGDDDDEDEIVPRIVPLEEKGPPAKTPANAQGRAKLESMQSFVEELKEARNDPKAIPEIVSRFLAE